MNIQPDNQTIRRVLFLELLFLLLLGFWVFFFLR
jgi:hypothetical protein